jgi:hypothetical protein
MVGLHSEERVLPMQLTVDVHRSTRQTASSGEASPGWILGPTVADDARLAIPRPQAYSFLSDCECPDDCLRDHENE